MSNSYTEDTRVFASCHNHSVFSDAEYTPEKLVELAHEMGHGGIILTDHDTVRGTYFINKAARKVGMKSILGCEFTTYYGEYDTHLLGFDFNPDNRKMKALLDYASRVATERTECLFKMGLERGSLREGISWQDVLDEFPYNDVIVNDHVFILMVKRGIYKSNEYREFVMPNFSYTLGPAVDAKVYETTQKSYKEISTEYVVKTILEAGGVPIVAHPSAKRRHIVKDYLDMGVMGFEFRHPDLWRENGMEEVVFYRDLCNEKKLYKMGGSDHSGILGGNLDRDPKFHIPDYFNGICEEDFMNIYERKLG
jgi:predicted metal-dependent phosphoesterase TrpH